MKYHRHQGVVEKDRKGHKKLWLGFFASFALVVYGGFLFTSTMLNGWPVESYDATARLVKVTKPGDRGDELYIPAINTQTSVGRNVVLKGTVGEQAIVSGTKFALGFTPQSMRNASPFFNLEKLREGDQIFLDSRGVRYAYEVMNSVDSDNRLTLTNGEVKKEAKALGTITWQDGKPILESL